MDKEELIKRIENNDDYTSEKYWDGFWERRKNKGGRKGLGVGGEDPDAASKALAQTHAFLWSGRTGNPNDPDRRLNLTVQGNENSGFFLTDEISGLDLSSDTLVNGYRWERNAVLEGVILPLIREYGEAEYRAMQEAFVRTAYTVGGMTVFPCRPSSSSINCARGCESRISDRPDLTMEWIRRYFFGEDTSLSDSVWAKGVLESNAEFFALFGEGRGGFKAFVDFFFLNDLVSADYASVPVFFGDNGFTRGGFPQTPREWLTWRDKATAFVKARNARILRALKDGTIDRRKAF